MEFTQSDNLSFGLELELQIVDKATGQLSPSSLELWDRIEHSAAAGRFALEATLATIELNSSVHSDAGTMLSEVTQLTSDLAGIGDALGVLIRGGGTQVTQFWNQRVIAPTPRAQELTRRFGFLPKRFSTYGMHVHVGASGTEEAVRMANGLQALVPLFIAMSAASPFLQMADTGFCASRPLESLVYPHGGPMPRLRDWAEFEQVAREIFSTELADSLKDIYWDVRPKPEFGTVEVRVFDTPLSVAKAVALAAFTRACAGLLLERSLVLPQDLVPSTSQRVSRFMACRDGLDAQLFNPFAQVWMPARQWLTTLGEMVLQQPLHASDGRQIRALLAYCAQTQDCQVIRDSWARAEQAAGSGEHDRLALNSQWLSGQLFAPLP